MGALGITRTPANFVAGMVAAAARQADDRGHAYDDVPAVDREADNGGDHLRHHRDQRPDQQLGDRAPKKRQIAGSGPRHMPDSGAGSTGFPAVQFTRPRRAGTAKAAAWRSARVLERDGACRKEPIVLEIAEVIAYNYSRVSAMLFGPWLRLAFGGLPSETRNEGGRDDGPVHDAILVHP